MAGRSASMKPPVLETKRLRLRPFVPTDAPVVRRLAGAREIADTTREIPHPYPEGAAETWIASHALLHEEGRALTLAVEEPGGRLIGAIGLRLHGEDRNAELGYWIAVEEWGRGYGTEAARAVLDFGFGVLGLHRIWATHFARNPASGRVMEKIGMSPEGTLRGHVRKWGRYEDLVVRAMLRSEWESRRSGEGRRDASDIERSAAAAPVPTSAGPRTISK
jgi:RimJ/RimL family protein N-acetyltransferase